MKNACFKDLSLELKRKILQEFGSPLLSIEYYDYRVDLYALNSLLIEQYENIESGQIEQIVEAAYNDLDKYLSRIVIGKIKSSLKGSL